MDRKNFLRGFGVGILFASIILGISFTLRTSDSAIISEAKKLGMVFANTEDKISFVAPDPNATPEVENTEVAQNEDAEATTVPEEEENVEATKEPTIEVVEKNNKKNDNQKVLEKKKEQMQEKLDAAKKQLVVNGGDWSNVVSKRLEDLGVIDSAWEFDQYLIKNGYSGKINVGTYEVSGDESYEELARKITSKYDRD